MVWLKRAHLLIHPVVCEYFRVKWSSYGSLALGLIFVLAFLNALFLITLVVFGSSLSLIVNNSLSVNESSDAMKLEQNASDNAISLPVTFQINMVGQIMRILALLCSSISIVMMVISLIKQWATIGNIIWPLFNLASMVFSCLFLIYPNPFDTMFLPVGAVAILLSWVLLFRTLQLIHSTGIYVSMFHRILIRAFQVLFIFVILLMAFAVPLFLLGRSNTEFSNLGYSLFFVFGYMLGEVQYSLFIENTGTHSVFLIVIVTVLADLLTIVMQIF